MIINVLYMQVERYIHVHVHVHVYKCDIQLCTCTYIVQLFKKDIPNLSSSSSYLGLSCSKLSTALANTS